MQDGILHLHMSTQRHNNRAWYIHAWLHNTYVRTIAPNLIMITKKKSWTVHYTLLESNRERGAF